MSKFLYKKPDLSVLLEGNIIIFKPIAKVSFSSWKEGFKIALKYVKQNYNNGNLIWLNDLSQLAAIDGKHQCFLQKYVNLICKFLKPPMKIYFIKPVNPFGIISMNIYLGISNLRWSDIGEFKVFLTKEEALSFISNLQKEKTQLNGLLDSIP
jgi:hypothetical protein